MSLFWFQEGPTCCHIPTDHVSRYTLNGYVEAAVARKYMDVESNVVVNRYILKGHKYELPCCLVKNVKHKYDWRCDCVVLKYNLYGFFTSHGLKELCVECFA